MSHCSQNDEGVRQDTLEEAISPVFLGYYAKTK
jgi:hypothetical protein